jgi:hypothetical protein
MKERYCRILNRSTKGNAMTTFIIALKKGRFQDYTFLYPQSGGIVVSKQKYFPIELLSILTSLVFCTQL